MTKILLSIFIMMLWVVTLKAQPVSTNPALPTADRQVTVSFDATKGSAGLKGYTGEVYAHMGVITDKSTGDSDWKYVKAAWDKNVDACKMTRTGSNSYAITISPSISEFYGVPAGEKILKMAFVFRSSDGTKTGKETGDKDVLVDVYEAALSVAFETPASAFFYVSPAQSIAVKVNAAFNESIELYLDNSKLAETTTNQLTHTFTAPTEGTHTLKAIAKSGTDEVETSSIFVIKTDTEEAPVPLVDYRRGFNRISDTEGLFVLFAPKKTSVYVAGDFNNWQPDNNYQMKKDGDIFWLQITGLDKNMEYAYQYWIDNDVKIADPYTNKILDPWNDKYIPESVYPNLKPYPVAGADNAVSVMTTKEDNFKWSVTNFKIPAKENLVIYELLIRDFTLQKDIKTITDSVSYFKRLGVNAIELLPFNEFEGNDSWGYNPSFFFATDKAYGTPDDYRTFIDVCHQNGIAVIMDMVLNHSFGQSPFAQMYLDGGKPSADNPWYNREHNMKNPDAQWGYDFNHESVHTQQLVDSICSYWMSEYKIDGFRFDFTKGFTNTPYPATSGDIWASAYDASRIKILKRMSDEIWKRKNDALVIFEHLSDNREEAELANHGIMLWGNMTHSYNQATMGYTSESDLSWAAYTNRSGWTEPNLVTYMESHDEERLMYKNTMYGNSFEDYSTKDVTTALHRMEAAAALFFTIPGPKMIWQFGERGYDVSINYDGRTSPKPPRWEYMKDMNRKQLFNVYSNLIKLKTTEPVFATTDFSMEVYGSVKKIVLRHSDNDVIAIANFGVKKDYVKPGFTHTGWWYNHYRGDSILVTNKDMTLYSSPGSYYLFSQKKMEGFNVITGIDDEVSIDSNIAVWPNPASSVININSEVAIQSVEVASLSGSIVVARGYGGNDAKVDVTSLPRGVYVITVSTADNRRTTHKIIKK